MRRRRDQQLTYEEVLSQRKFLIEVGLSAEMNYRLGLFKEADTPNERELEVLSDSRITNKDKERNLAEAYAELYEEIVQGYERGTRKIRTTDRRTLKKEDELRALDAAYAELVKRLNVQKQRADDQSQSSNSFSKSAISSLE